MDFILSTSLSISEKPPTTVSPCLPLSANQADGGDSAKLTAPQTTQGRRKGPELPYSIELQNGHAFLIESVRTRGHR